MCSFLIPPRPRLGQRVLDRLPLYLCNREWVVKKSLRLAGEIQQKHVRRKHLPMLCLILIVGGLLIMMGQHDRSEALFYYFRLEDQVPETHLLRLKATECGSASQPDAQP
jgi:hypothetical protein